MNEKPRTKYFRIGEVAKITGLPAYTIRYWEQEFPKLSPRKSASGRRLYSPEELELIKRIQNLLHQQGFTIRGARELLEKEDANPNIPTPDREARLLRKLQRLRKLLLELHKLLEGDDSS